MRKMGLLGEGQTQFEANNNKQGDQGLQTSRMGGFSMQGIKEHMMEQLDNIHVYDNINTKDAVKSALEKKQRDLSALNKTTRTSFGNGPDDSKTASPLKRAKSAMMNKKPQDKRASFTTDPRKVENLNVKRQGIQQDGSSTPNDLNLRSPSARLTKTPTPVPKKATRGGQSMTGIH